jgi:predicted secreted protein
MKKIAAFGSTIGCLAVFGMLISCRSYTFAEPVLGNEKQITIELDGNRTTGYSWTYTMEPDGIVREISSEYRVKPETGEASAATDGRATGRGGVFVFTFESLKAGTTKLHFEYVRPWERTQADTAPVLKKDYLLTVDEAGKVSALVSD